MGFYSRYEANKLIERIAKGTHQVRRDMGRVFAQHGINELNDIVTSDKQKELQELLNNIDTYQDEFISAINILNTMSNNSYIDLEKIIIGSSDLTENNSLNLKSLFDTSDLQQTIAIQGLSAYNNFKQNAIDVFLENIELQNDIHKGTKFYDMFAVETKEGTNLYMLDQKGLSNFMKNTNFIDFIPEMEKNYGSILTTNQIKDFSLSLNPSTAKKDVILDYFNQKIMESGSGVYQLDSTVAGQIFNSQEYKNYMSDTYKNNPNRGQLIEPVLSNLLMGKTVQDTFDSAKTNLYKTLRNGEKKLNIAAGTFGGAVGDSFGRVLFKEGKSGSKNLFSFIGEGSLKDLSGWRYETVNTQIKGFNFTEGNTARVTFGSLSSIYQNTRMYADPYQFNAAKDEYGMFLMNTYQKKSQQRIQKEFNQYNKELEELRDGVKADIEKFKDNLLELGLSEDWIDNFFDEWANSDEFKEGIIEDYREQFEEDNWSDTMYSSDKE